MPWSASAFRGGVCTLGIDPALSAQKGQPIRTNSKPADNQEYEARQKVGVYRSGICRVLVMRFHMAVFSLGTAQIPFLVMGKIKGDKKSHNKNRSLTKLQKDILKKLDRILSGKDRPSSHKWTIEKPGEHIEIKKSILKVLRNELEKAWCGKDKNSG